MRKGFGWTILVLLLLVLAGVLLSTQISIFVIQPIGALPEGRTLVISRLTNMKFIDSADAICDRAQNGVSLMCRVMVMGQVAKTATIYMRLPYSKTLYLISTEGKSYER